MERCPIAWYGVIVFDYQAYTIAMFGIHNDSCRGKVYKCNMAQVDFRAELLTRSGLTREIEPRRERLEISS
jgi:hypothetical protein